MTQLLMLIWLSTLPTRLLRLKETESIFRIMVDNNNLSRFTRTYPWPRTLHRRIGLVTLTSLKTLERPKSLKIQLTIEGRKMRHFRLIGKRNARFLWLMRTWLEGLKIIINLRALFRQFKTKNKSSRFWNSRSIELIMQA